MKHEGFNVENFYLGHWSLWGILEKLWQKSLHWHWPFQFSLGGLHRLRIQVFRSSWWMMHYGSLSPKRHMCLTNNPYAEKFNKGKLSRSEQKAKTTRKTVVKYVSKDGRPSYKGSDALKATQSLDLLQGWCWKKLQTDWKKGYSLIGDSLFNNFKHLWGYRQCPQLFEMEGCVIPIVHHRFQSQRCCVAIASMGH